MRPVDVPEVAVGVDAVAHQLLQLLDVREAAVALALPDQLAVEPDLEDAAGAGTERHVAELEAEGREHFLRHPGGAQQPVALGAVGDGEVRLVDHICGSAQDEKTLLGSTSTSGSSSACCLSAMSCAVVVLTRWASSRAICSSQAGWASSTSSAFSMT